MESLKKLFKLSNEVHPEWGAFIHLCRAVRGTGTSKRNISKLFKELMPLEEYNIEDKQELLDYLLVQSLQSIPEDAYFISIRKQEIA